MEWAYLFPALCPFAGGRVGFALLFQILPLSIFHTEPLYLLNAVFHQIRLWTYAYMEQQAKMRVEWMILVCGDGEAQEAGHWRGSFPSRSRMQDTIHLATTSSSQ